MADIPPDDVLRHIVDVHCHPTDTFPISSESMKSLKITVCAMSSREVDQVLVRGLATSYPTKVIPCFGYHPWFSHYITFDNAASREVHYRNLFLEPQKVITLEHRDAFDKLLPNLPEPLPLCSILAELRHNLLDFPNAMVGEVGIDRSFHVPFDFYEKPRRRTPFNVPIHHQLTLLEAQLDMAVELGRNASVHSVHLQQATVELFDRLARKHGDSFYRISIDLHSCGLSPETWGTIQKKHVNIYISLSTVINGKSSNHKALIAACANDRILAESDYDSIDMSTPQTWDIIKTIAEIKQWKIETTWVDLLPEKEWGVVHHLKSNWERFQRGNHAFKWKPVKHRKEVDRYHSPPSP